MIFPWFRVLSVRLSARLSRKMVRFTSGTDQNIPVPGAGICLMCVTLQIFLFDDAEYCDLENLRQGHSKLLEMTPFNRTHTIYWRYALIMAVYIV